MRRYTDDWDELARREPYYAVLTEPRFLSDAMDEEQRRAFFATGEADVERLLGIAGLTPRTALDFGCGVGRLTRALAKRVERVTGCDVSPRMLELARRNVPHASFVTALDDSTFDFICSLIVFQHIPVAEGLRLFAGLLRRLAPGGVAIIHFSLRRPGGVLRRLARRLRAAAPALHRLALRWRRDELALPYMQVNEYSRAAIARVAREVTGGEPEFIRDDQNEVEGALVIVRR
jgi:SAM-dependent methyltransferase